MAPHGPFIKRGATSMGVKGLLRFASVAVFATLLGVCAQEALAARVVAEKNCSVRIDEELPPGQKVFVVRQQGGRTKRIAVVQVSRSGRGISLGKVVQGPRPCGGLKGLSVQTAGGKDQNSSGAPAKGLSLLPALDADLQFQYVMFSGEGLHQRTDQPVPTLSLFGAGLQLDAWPGLFIDRKSYLLQAIGLGIRYSFAQSIPEIDVNPPPESANQESGKQQINPTTLLAELAGRFPYLEGKLATEIRVGYLMHDLEHTLTTQGSLPRAPLRDVHYAGLTVGLKQRMRFIEPMRVNLGVTLPVMLSGTADNTSEKTADRASLSSGDVKDAAGLLVDASVDGILKMFKGTFGVSYETYGSTVDLLEGGSMTLDQTSLTFYIGAGVFL